jgi:hypothetical protein
MEKEQSRCIQNKQILLFLCSYPAFLLFIYLCMRMHAHTRTHARAHTRSPPPPACCFNCCKPLKKNSDGWSSNQQWPLRRTKNGDLSIAFQSREQVVVRRDRLQVPGEPGYCHARTRPHWWPSRSTIVYYKRSYMFRCLRTMFRELRYCVFLVTLAHKV